MSLFQFFLGFVLCFASPDDPVRVSLELKDHVGDVATLDLGLEILEKGFRVYRDSIRVLSPQGEVTENNVPTGQKRMDPFSKKEKEIYTSKIAWPIKIQTSFPAIEVSVTYRACNDVICHLPKTKKLKVDKKNKPVQAGFSQSLEQFWTLVTETRADQVKALAAENIWLAILLCFVSGILTSFTPCVYPMIPITINIFGRQAQKSSKHKGSYFNAHVFSLSVVYVAGMSLTYSCLGLIAGFTGSLFGQLLQSTWVLLSLTLIFLLLALSQLGVFKLALPASVQTQLARVGSSDSRGGIFLMGMISGLIVSPCVGPVIAGILAFVLDSSNALKGFLYFLSFSMGLGVLFLLIGAFSGSLSRLPRSGPWMMGVNRILAILMMVASGYYANLWARSMGFISRGENAEQSHWILEDNKAQALALSQKKPMLVDFTADWCEACHEIDKTLFQNPEIQKRLENFVLLRIDVTMDSPDSEEKLKKYGVTSLPSLRFVGRDGTLLATPRVHGIVTVDEFHKILSQADPAE